MSKFSFLNFHYGNSRKSAPKLAQFSRKQTSSLPRVFQPNLEEMKLVFNKFDSNKDGKISPDEYKLALRALGRSKNDEADVSKAFEFFDSNEDGFIDFEEFMKMQSQGGAVKMEDIQSAFRVFDLDGNGKISAEELLEVLKRLGERCSLETCRKMVRRVDIDGDGLINMEEFTSMMTQNMKVA